MPWYFGISGTSEISGNGWEGWLFGTNSEIWQCRSELYVCFMMLILSVMTAKDALMSVYLSMYWTKQTPASSIRCPTAVSLLASKGGSIYHVCSLLGWSTDSQTDIEKCGLRDRGNRTGQPTPNSLHIATLQSKKIVQISQPAASQGRFEPAPRRHNVPCPMPMPHVTQGPLPTCSLSGKKRGKSEQEGHSLYDMSSNQVCVLSGWLQPDLYKVNLTFKRQNIWEWQLKPSAPKASRLFTIHAVLLPSEVRRRGANLQTAIPFLLAVSCALRDVKIPKTWLLSFPRRLKDNSTKSPSARGRFLPCCAGLMLSRVSNFSTKGKLATHPGHIIITPSSPGSSVFADCCWASTGFRERMINRWWLRVPLWPVPGRTFSD